MSEKMANIWDDYATAVHAVGALGLSLQQAQRDRHDGDTPLAKIHLMEATNAINGSIRDILDSLEVGLRELADYPKPPATERTCGTCAMYGPALFRTQNYDGYCPVVPRGGQNSEDPACEKWRAKA